MTGSEYVAEFIHKMGCKRVYTITGGACAFLIDAVAQHPDLDYVCFQHEQAAAMACDAAWHVRGIPGVTIATSGPGATNLITGIACSYFDSIPAIHLTGQVNNSESAAFHGAKVRQAGFQETNIVDMVRPITKYAVRVNSADELRRELRKAYHCAVSGRMGPVLIDIPMNVQKDYCGDNVEYDEPPSEGIAAQEEIAAVRDAIDNLLLKAKRPLVLLGAGLGLAGTSAAVIKWLREQSLPFVSSWSGMSYFDHNDEIYCGPIGVYGNRGANYILQNCDALLVLGSRLDTRQRSGRPREFAPGAKVLVVDIDAEELKKYGGDSYDVCQLNLAAIPQVLNGMGEAPVLSSEWTRYIAEMKSTYLWRGVPGSSVAGSEMSPYSVVQCLNGIIHRDAVVVADTGANLCWVYQVFKRTEQILFTAAGNSPMGYSLPAAIGAALEVPGRQIISFIGDGGLQTNIQELQTVAHYRLPVKLVVLNNRGYGIIKQFQDSYFGSRYEASGQGYSVPDFGKIARAYGICYQEVTALDQLRKPVFESNEPYIIDVKLNEHAQILPKLEMGRPINDQFPYVSDEEFERGNAFVPFARRKTQ